MRDFKQHAKKVKKQHYGFNIDLDSAELSFNPTNPNKFTIIADSRKGGDHVWAHFNADTGSINSDDLQLALSTPFDKKNTRQSNLRIASIPVSALIDVEGESPNAGGSAFLFKSKKIKHQNNKLIWKGSLLSNEYVADNQKFLRTAFGQNAVHNHLRFDPLNAFSFERDPNASYSFFSSLADSITDTTKAITNPIAKATVDVGKWTGTAVDKAVDAVKDGTSSTLNFVKGAGASVVNAADDIYDALTNEYDWNFALKWPKIDSGDIKMPDEDLGPFVADLSVQTELVGDLELTHGIIGALDPNTVALRLTPSAEFDGSVELVKPGFDFDKTFTLASASIPLSDPPVITGASASLSFKVKVDAGVEDKLLNLGGEITFTPSAQLTLGNGKVSLQDESKDPVFTATLPTFGSEDLNPTVDFIVTFTPQLTVTLGPAIPKTIGGEKVPFVGGTGLGDVKTTLSNPVVLSWDSSNPETILVETSGLLDSHAELLGATLTPAFADYTLYGPISSSINV